MVEHLLFAQQQSPLGNALNQLAEFSWPLVLSISLTGRKGYAYAHIG